MGVLSVVENAVSPQVTGDAGARFPLKPHGQVMPPPMETGRFLLCQGFFRVPYNFSRKPEPPYLYRKRKDDQIGGLAVNSSVLLLSRAARHFSPQGKQEHFWIVQANLVMRKLRPQ